jgi:hypothetical protein
MGSAFHAREAVQAVNDLWRGTWTFLDSLLLSPCLSRKYLIINMVGPAGFEPTTS